MMENYNIEDVQLALKLIKTQNVPKVYPELVEGFSQFGFVFCPNLRGGAYIREKITHREMMVSRWVFFV